MLLLSLGCSVTATAADGSLYVGEPGYLSGPSYTGVMDAIAWYSDRSNDISISGDASGASVVIQSYFSGVATIECQYGYHYYSGGRRHNQTGHLRFTLSCRASTVTIDKSSLSIGPGGTATLTYSNSSGYKLPIGMWRTDNDKIALVDDGERAVGKQTVTIKGVAPGTCNITLYANTGGDNPVCKVSVADVPANSIALSPSELKIQEGKTGSFKYTLTPSNSSSKISWRISDESVATITSKGVIKGIREGRAIVTATTDNGLSATGTVIIAGQPTSVSLGGSARLYLGYSSRITPALIPSTAMTTYTWKSDNTKVVTVSSSGILKAVSAGQALITVKTANGLEASVRVTVVEAPEGLDAANARSRTAKMKKLINSVLKTR